MKRQIAFTGLFIIVALMLVACGGRAAQTVSDVVYIENEGMAVAVEEPAIAPMPGAEFGMDAAISYDTGTYNESLAAQLPVGEERLIIRSADMGIVATDTEVAMAQIAAMVEKGGGWVVSSNVYQSTDTAKTGYIQIRVPAAGFDSVLEAIRGLAVEVTRLSTSGTDVTEEYVDLDARLGNLEATADRLRTFLEEARNVEDALAVNQELSRIEGEIESLKGRMKYLEQSSAFSSINVDITPDELAQPVQVGNWQPTGVAKEAVESLINALQWLAEAAIWFAIFVLPILALIALPFVFIIWLIRRLRRREQAAAANEQTPADK